MTGIVHGQGVYLLQCHHVMVGCSRGPPDCLVTVDKRLTVADMETCFDCS